MYGIASYASMLLSITLAPMPGFIQQAQSQAVSVIGGPGLPDGFVVVPTTWDFKFGDEALTYQGTIEEALAQVKVMKPDMTDEQLIQAMNDAHPSVASSYSNIPTKMDLAPADNITCRDPAFTPRPAIREAILEGIEVLKQIHHRRYVPFGNQTCARVSCSYHSGIYMCGVGDNLPRPICSDLAPKAEAIVDACTDDSRVELVQGTWSDQLEPYIVHVGGDSC